MIKRTVRLAGVANADGSAVSEVWFRLPYDLLDTDNNLVRSRGPIKLKLWPEADGGTGYVMLPVNDDPDITTPAAGWSYEVTIKSKPEVIQGTLALPQGDLSEVDFLTVFVPGLNDATSDWSDIVRKSMLLAKGDIYVATAAGTIERLAVGPDGQAIVADSSTATGLKYVSISGGGGGGGPVAWVDITGKPSTFAPSAHASSHGSAGSDPVALNASQITAGTVSIARLPTGTTSTSVALGDHLHAGVYSTIGHTHLQSDVANLVSDLAAKASLVHTHAEGDITNLVTDLAGKTSVLRAIATGTGLVGGGDFQADRTISMANMAANSLKGNNTAGSAAPGDLTVSQVATMLGGTSSTTLALGNHNHTGVYSAVGHTHPESDITNLVTDLAAKSPLASPTFTGTVTIPAALRTGRNTITPTALTDAATVLVDASLNDVFTLTIGGNRTLGNPSNPPSSTNRQKLLFIITQNGTGNNTLALGTSYAFGADITSITLSTGANKKDYLGVMWNPDTSKWDVIAFVKGY